MTCDHAAELRPVLGRIAGNTDLPKAARVAAADAEMATDVEAVMARTGATIVALEAAATTAEAAAKELRQALLDLMVETGAPTISIGTHTIGVSETARVRITDAAAVPPALMVQPPPKPDTQAIGAALRAGQSIPGAVLSNAEPSLFIRARKS